MRVDNGFLRAALTRPSPGAGALRPGMRRRQDAFVNRNGGRSRLGPERASRDPSLRALPARGEGRRFE